MLLMAVYPEIQNRVRNEIHANIGRERPPHASDRAELQFTEAVLFEVQRLASIVSTSVAHRAMKVLTIDGFDIPENAVIMSNFYAVHHDPKLWADPENFNPEANFLRRNSGGQYEIVNTEHLIPFGVGRRLCLGESLARQELWIFFVGLMQRFELKSDPSKPLPSSFASASPYGIIRAPLPYQVIFK